MRGECFGDIHKQQNGHLIGTIPTTRSHLAFQAAHMSIDNHPSFNYIFTRAFEGLLRTQLW